MSFTSYKFTFSHLSIWPLLPNLFGRCSPKPHWLLPRNEEGACPHSRCHSRNEISTWSPLCREENGFDTIFKWKLQSCLIRASRAPEAAGPHFPTHVTMDGEWSVSALTGHGRLVWFCHRLAPVRKLSCSYKLEGDYKPCQGINNYMVLIAGYVIIN